MLLVFMVRRKTLKKYVSVGISNDMNWPFILEL